MSQDLLATFTKTFPDGPRIEIENLITSGPASTTILFGASGSGKTTILRCLAGLERPEEGSIRFGDEIWFEAQKRIFTPPQKRGLGFVPQDYALFPHLSVARNVGYGLNHLGSAERRARLSETIQWLELQGLEQRRPAQLSGGQRQRVALARALVRRPRLLLLDEPLSALDGPTRVRLQGDLRQLLKHLGIPSVLVTHERTEALALGDQLIVIDAGRVVQRGPVHEVFSQPANLTVAGIVAMETVQPARVLDSVNGLTSVRVGEAQLISLASSLTPGSEVYVCIRAEDVTLVKGQPTQSSPRNCLPVVVKDLVTEGPVVRISLEAGFPLTAMLTKQACEELTLTRGDEMTALIKAPQIHLIPR
jgi:molybdate transport system ATP-binding protein